MTSPPNWQLILDAAEALTASGQAPFTRVSVYEWIWRRYPRSEHDRPSLDPTFQGMVGNAPGGPPSPCGTPLHRTGHGRYVLATVRQDDCGQTAAPASQHGGSDVEAGAYPADLVALPGHDRTDKAKWLWTRLDSHASGRRSGDPFNVCICDRFIVPALTPGQQSDIADGKLLLDQLTKAYIRKHLSYRFTIYPSGQQALSAEQQARAGALPAGRPYLNPL